MGLVRHCAAGEEPGVAYDGLGHFRRALKVYAKAIVLAANNPGLRNDLGTAYFNIGSYIEATKAYQQALKIDPSNARAHFCLGLVYLDLDEKELALEKHVKLEALGESEFAFQLLDKIQRQRRRAS